MNNYKSATTAGLLGIFLGSVGAHDWYLGNKTKGIIHVCLASSGVVISIIASVVLPAALSYRALLTWGALITILAGLSGLIMFGNGVWGLVEGIIILSQGDAGLARKGYAVMPQMNYNRPMNNMNNVNNMGNMNTGMANNDNNIAMNNNQNNGQNNANNLNNVNSNGS